MKRFALYDDARRVARVLANLKITELVDVGEASPINARVFQSHGIVTRQLGYLKHVQS